MYEPTTKNIFLSLLRADLTAAWRNRRSFIMLLIVPIIILISWKEIVEKLGGPFALSSCITFGLIAGGLMAYTNNLARDREKGILERLRATPAPTWTIMTSRLTVQLILITAMVILVFLAGYFIDHIVLSPAGYICSLITSIVGGAVFLALGQAIVGRIASADTVNGATRLIYFAFVLVGAFGELGVLGTLIETIIKWSPYGAVKLMILGSMQPSLATTESWLAIFATLVYIGVFATLGIRWFKWKVV
jgi:ABC-2 type transport system permease protein